MGSRRQKPPARRGPHTARRLALPILVTLLFGVSMAPGGDNGRSVTITFAPAFLPAGPQNCSDNVLENVTSSPAKVAVTPLEAQTFSAVADSACGTPLVGNVSIVWWLSSASLGTLSASHGTTTAYTACLAPMDGTLHVKATWGGLTRYANSSISVAGRSGSGPKPPPSSSDAGSGGAGSPSPVGVPWGALAIMVALLGGAAIVLILGRRKQE